MMRSSSSWPLVQVLERRFLLSTVTYNRTAAVAYATQYANKVVGDGYFWINGGTYNYYGAGAAVPVNQANEADGIGDDCAHFVSSCIGAPAGGLSINSRVPPTYGEPGAAALDQLLLTDGYATQVSSISQLQPGDVIGYDWDGGSKISGIDHTVIYMGNNLICAHSTSHYDVAYNSLGSGTIFYFHINTPAGPLTPTNTSPTSGSVVTTATPKLTASAFSESGATQSAAEWQIYNGSTLVYDSGANTTNKTSITVPAGKLASGNTYTWQVRYEDNFSNWSSYSTATSFTVTIGPYTAVNSSPANGATVYNPVTLSASAFSDTQSGATHTASEWLVKNSSSSTVFDSGADTSDLASITVPSADLTASQTYSWQVRYQDNSGYWGAYSSATSFTVAAPGPLTLPVASAYYLQDTANGQALNIWNATTNTGAPSQTIALNQITKIIMNGASTGSNFTIDFANGSPSPQNHISITDPGNSANNFLTVLGSASANDAISAAGEQIAVNSTLIIYSTVGTVTFIPGAGADSFSLSSGAALSLGGSGSFSSLGIPSGASLNIGGFTANVLDSGATESNIQSMIAAGEITSNLVTSDTTSTTAIGYFDDGTQIAIRATWKGDSNLDGVVNADDLSLMMLGQSQNKSDWQSGNFNNTAQINADDWMDFYYALAYSAGRSYSSVFASPALQSQQDMSQILSPANQGVLL